MYTHRNFVTPQLRYFKANLIPTTDPIVTRWRRVPRRPLTDPDTGRARPARLGGGRRPGTTKPATGTSTGNWRPRPGQFRIRRPPPPTDRGGGIGYPNCGAPRDCRNRVRRPAHTSSGLHHYARLHHRP